MRRHTRPRIFVTLTLWAGLALTLAGCPEGSEGGSSSATEGDDTTSSGGSDSAPSESSDATGDPPMSTATSMTTGGGSTSTSTGELTTTTIATDDSMTDEVTGDTSGTSASSTSSTSGGPTICGDGLLDPDEECDAGEQNGIEGGECNADCTLPSCGDGYFDPDEEECDGTDPDLVETAICTDACTWEGVIAFVTFETFQGDLGGLAGADTLCKTAAEVAGLTSPDGYRAWLGVSTKSAASRIPLVEKPYYRLDGEMIAANKDDLLGGKLLSPIVVTELKSTLMSAPVWTNSSADGSVESLTEDCQSFASPSEGDLGGVGLAGKTDGGWTSLGTSTCDRYRRLYCFSEAF